VEEVRFVGGDHGVVVVRCEKLYCAVDVVHPHFGDTVVEAVGLPSTVWLVLWS